MRKHHQQSISPRNLRLRFSVPVRTYWLVAFTIVKCNNEEKPKGTEAMDFAENLSRLRKTKGYDNKEVRSAISDKVFLSYLSQKMDEFRRNGVSAAQTLDYILEMTSDR